MRTSIWLLTAGLLVAMISAANGQPTEGEETYNPAKEARAAVDGFLSKYHSGMSDSLLIEELGQVREWPITLREIGDQRLVKPLTEIIADTALHSDGVDSRSLYMLLQLRGKTAVPAIGQYLNVQSKPNSRLLSAAALTVLGEAESGIPILEGYDLEPGPLSEGAVPNVIMGAFFDDWQAVRLDNPVQESSVASYFQRRAEWVSGEDLKYAICYLLQKDEKSRAIAFRRAEDVLKTPAASRKTVPYSSIRVLLERFGGERGKVLLSKYQ